MIDEGCQARKTWGSRRLPSLVVGIALALTAGSTWAQLAPIPAAPSAVTRTASTVAPDWTAIDLREHFSQPGVHWTVYLESAETGLASSAALSSPIRQTRLRIARQEKDGGETDLAFVQHTSNLEIRIFTPGDPALEAAPIASESGGNPWPNQCGFSFVETRHTIDIDEDDQLDLAVKYYATVPDPEARGMLLLDEGEGGIPNLVSLEPVVKMLDVSLLALQDLVYEGDSEQPMLEVRYRPLQECRFLAQLDIRGEAQCDNCCDIPVFLREMQYRVYQPTYYRPRQSGLLDRVRHDIAAVADNDPEQPLSSGAQAALARMASFFYLTGQGVQTRDQLALALGPRATDYRARLLVDKLEKFFLTPEAISPTAAAPVDGSPAAAPSRPPTESPRVDGTDNAPIGTGR